LLKNLLELSRIGRLASQPVEVSLEELAAEARELVHGQALEAGVQVDIAPGLPTVKGDRIRLVEVFQNLIDNGIKYMGDQDRPRIEIGARRDENQTVCYVRDNGIGIDPRYQEKIFGLFDQLDQKVDGTGIGLALVQRIIEIHGGRIWVESEGPGRGSTFCFTIANKAQASEAETI
jgi:signal transduction histidine kinase